jgi:actinin alpha
LLEAQDIVNSPKPDDKSIMAYVAEFFHAFANLETEEAGTEKLKQYIVFHKQLLPLVRAYRNISDPAKWAEEKTQWYTFNFDLIADP